MESDSDCIFGPRPPAQPSLADDLAAGGHCDKGLLKLFTVRIYDPILTQSRTIIITSNDRRADRRTVDLARQTDNLPVNGEPETVITGTPVPRTRTRMACWTVPKARTTTP